MDPQPRGDLPEGPAVQDACLDDDAVGEVEAAGLAAPPLPSCSFASPLRGVKGETMILQVLAEFLERRVVAFTLSSNVWPFPSFPAQRSKTYN